MGGLAESVAVADGGQSSTDHMSEPIGSAYSS